MPPRTLEVFHNIRFSPALFKQIEARGMEGIVVKKDK